MQPYLTLLYWTDNMPAGFSADFFVQNRKRLRELYDKAAPIIVTANGLVQRNSDMAYPFRQDSSFWYLTGLDEPDLTLVMLRDSEFLIAKKQTQYQDIFDGSVDWKQLQNTSGIRTILTEEEGWQRVRAAISRVKIVATPAALPEYLATYGMYVNPARAKLAQRLQELKPSLELDDIRTQLASLRVIKQPAEIKAIKKAVDVTCEAFLAVQQRQYDSENQLEADLGQLFRAAGAKGHGYTPIVAGGLNACTLHYAANNARLRHGRLVLVDAGAEYQNYSADITRTWPVGRLTARQRAVLEAVNEAVEYGLTLFSPDISFYELLEKVRDFIGRKLVELKLTKRLTKEIVNQFFPHTSHYLGLDVHDVGDPRLPLQPGMVMTLEPGIYIPEEFIGVRIEENILMTEKGPEVLSKQLPRLLQ